MKLFVLAAAALAMASCGSAATETRVLRETPVQHALETADSFRSSPPHTPIEKESKAIEKETKKAPAKPEIAENRELVRQRNAVRSLITIEDLKFKRIFLGGFKNIRFNLYNRYNHKVDQVTLTVHYIRANGSEAHAATQTVRNLGAHSKVPVTAPDFTSAGMSMKVTVETVTSREIELCYDSSRDKFSSDPYHCQN